MLKEANTLPAILFKRAREFPNDTAFLRKEFGVWHRITWSQYLENVRFLSLGMISLGLKKGDKVVFISKEDQVFIRKAQSKRLSQILERQKPWKTSSLEFQRKVREEWGSRPS